MPYTNYTKFLHIYTTGHFHGGIFAVGVLDKIHVLSINVVLGVTTVELSRSLNCSKLASLKGVFTKPLMWSL